MKRHSKAPAVQSALARDSRHLAGLAGLALSLLALLAFAPIASGAAPKTVVNTVGSPEIGQAGGRFKSPQGVAVNQTGAGGVPAGTFYVVDSGNQRVQRFGPTGAFVSTWGWGVGGGGEFEVCTKAVECQQGKFADVEGSAAGYLAGMLSTPRTIAVDQSNGNIYVSDRGGENQRINVFGAKGTFEGAFGMGVINGENEFQFCTTQTGCHSPTFSGNYEGRGGGFPGEIGGLAVDAAGKVYVANTANLRVDVFQPTVTAGVVTAVEFLRSFGWGVNAGNEEFETCTAAIECKQGRAGAGAGQFAANSPSDVAVDSEGNIFALDAGNKRVQKFSSVPEPLNASFGSAALEALFGSGAELFNIAIDPSVAPNHLLVSGGRLGSEGRAAIAELDGLGDNALGAGKAHGEDLPATSAKGLAAAPAALGGSLYLTTETIGVLRGAFVLGEAPTIEPVTSVTGTTAIFKGKVVSNEIEVSYHFEYSTDGKTWTKVPASDVNAGTQPGTIEVQQEAKGLTGSQLYRVRLVQNRPLGGGIATSAETTFTTLAEKPAILGGVASPIKDTSATFNAYIDPQNQATAYRFEYGPADCSANPCTALPVSEANGGGLRLVSQTVTGLQPATTYHFRLVATNATGTTEGPDRSFETFAAGRQLPDDRAYELVTPPDTGAVVLAGVIFGEGAGRDCFDMFPATADGNSVVSASKGGSLPGLDVNGRFDLYESVRDPVKGWSTGVKSASGAQSTLSAAGLCVSPDHLYSTLGTGSAPSDQGSLVVEGKASNYIRGPEGTFELVGRGSEPVTDPEANARWVTAGASHIVFTSKKHLEPNAPPSGTEAVYDRSLDGPTRVVSLLPGDVALSTPAVFQGVSADGSTILFSNPGGAINAGKKLYARLDNASTVEVAVGASGTGTVIPAGASANGDRVFYVKSGNAFSFDTANQVTTQITTTGNAQLVNISDDGSHVYFVSVSALTGAEKNDQGQEALGGANNLYVWDEASKEIHFIAIVSSEDLIGKNQAPGLTQWTSEAVNPNPTVNRGRRDDSSRTTPDGSVFLFESRADITGSDSGGHIEIYRYDADTAGLECVSCPPTGVPAVGDARLQAPSETPLLPTSAIVHIQNVTDDGQKVFFQTEDALVPGDLNGTWDVYEWKAGQQAYLISSGHGQLPSFLYGMTPSGSDVFFTSTERLVPRDVSTVSSIYDARVGGGFPEAATQPPCQGDNCQGTPSVAPQLVAPGSAAFRGAGNEARKHKPRCPKNKQRAKRNGKTRCVKKHQPKAKRRRANRDRRAAR